MSLFPKLWLLAGVWLFASTNGYSQEAMRVAGEYRVEEIRPLGDGGFRLTFSSKHKTGRFDRLFLTTDHIHMRLKPGQMLKLSAEVARDHKDSGEASQVLVFLNSDQNVSIPVWLLSKTFVQKPLRGARYLEMHAPTSDFLVL